MRLESKRWGGRQVSKNKGIHTVLNTGDCNAASRRPLGYVIFESARAPHVEL